MLINVWGIHWYQKHPTYSSFVFTVYTLRVLHTYSTWIWTLFAIDGRRFGPAALWNWRLRKLLVLTWLRLNTQAIHKFVSCTSVFSYFASQVLDNAKLLNVAERTGSSSLAQILTYTDLKDTYQLYNTQNRQKWSSIQTFGRITKYKPYLNGFVI